MNEQIKFSFDQATLIKICKGAFYAILPVVGITLLQFLGTIQIDNPLIASLAVWGIPTAINAIKEWQAGN